MSYEPLNPGIIISTIYDLGPTATTEVRSSISSASLGEPLIDWADTVEFLPAQELPTGDLVLWQLLARRGALQGMR